MSDQYPCPCCGYLMFDQGPGSFDICWVCNWQDGIAELVCPEMSGGANGRFSLIECQRAFAQSSDWMGEHDPDDIAKLVRDPLWRPIDPTRDKYLHWMDPDDMELWKGDLIKYLHWGNLADPETWKYPPVPGIYYWRPDYWLNDAKYAARKPG